MSALIHSTDWTTGSFGSTTAGGAGTTTGAGDGWIDVAGGKATAGSANLLTFAATGAGSYNTSQYLLRPASENILSQQLVASFTQASPEIDRYIVLRHVATNTNYLLGFVGNGTALYAFRNASGTLTQVGTEVTFPAPTTGHVIRLTASISGTTANALSLAAYDVTSSTLLATLAVTDSTPPTALQSAGQCGLMPNAGTATFLTAATYDASAIAVTDANWQHAPYNTYLTGGVAAILCEGGSPATLKVANTGNLALSVDVSRAVSAGLATGNYPVVSCWLDGMALADFQLTPTTATIPFLASGTVGTHTISYVFRSGFCPAGDTGVSKWVPTGSPALPPYAVVISGAVVDAGAASVSQALPVGGTDLVQGDSITETLRVNDANDTAFSGDATKGFAQVIRQTFGSQLGQIGYGATGYESSGQGGVPSFSNNSGLYFQGVSRLDGSGHYQPVPDRIWIVHGTNGTTTQADVATTITAARSRAPLAQINVCVPPGGFARSVITAAVAASGDAKVALKDAGTDFQTGLTAFVAGGTSKSSDGIHPNAATQTAYGNALAAAAPVITSYTLPISLTKSKTFGF